MPLPKWAREKIARLEQEQSLAAKRIADLMKLSDDPGECALVLMEPGGRLRERGLSESHVVFRLSKGKDVIDVHVEDDALVVRSRTGGLALHPVVSNAIKVKAVRW